MSWMNTMLSAGSAGKAFSALRTKAGEKISTMTPGMFSDTAKWALDHGAKNPTIGAALVGGVVGGAGGIISNDPDMHWYSGAAMGAGAAAGIGTHGLSKAGVAGAIAGGVYGMFADDTSIMGGAFMGAGLGAGIRYGRIGKAGYKNARENVRMIETKQAPGKFRSTGFGLNAVSQAISRDLGFGWRGQGAKRGLRSNKLGASQRAGRRQDFRKKNRGSYGGGRGGGGGMTSTPPPRNQGQGTSNADLYNMGFGGVGAIPPKPKPPAPAPSMSAGNLEDLPGGAFGGGPSGGGGGGMAPAPVAKPPARNQASGSTAPAKPAAPAPAPAAAPAAAPVPTPAAAPHKAASRQQAKPVNEASGFPDYNVNSSMYDMHGPHPPPGMQKGWSAEERQRYLKRGGYDQGVEDFFKKNMDTITEISEMSHPSQAGWQGTGKNFGRASYHFDEAVANESPGSMLSALKTFGNSLPRNHPMGVKTARLINETKGLSRMRGDTWFPKGKK